MITLYITRHGETVWNTEKRMQGWRDSELTENGIRNAVLLGDRLRDIPFDAIYSSPSTRTRSTADLIKAEKDIPVIFDENLKEINLGKWEGKTVSFIEKHYSDQFHCFWNTPHLYTAQTGENFGDLKNRVLEFLTSLRENHSSGTVLIVTHSVVIKTMLSHFKNEPLEKLWDPPFIHDTSLTIVELNGETYKIVTEGDISHRVFEEIEN
ncbi:histidine phosphatase family protein [Bacillus marinisedimentorum]|uniref:histidine phosphatase family protein n=1 Tax=Bacillus marinisedimentorum TaxID=1821260 RepID=UPI0008724246|nr:histidine phosphatase family protein [Bacillus marinisedimentorum]